MNQAVTQAQVNTYRATGWKVGSKSVRNMNKQLQKLQKLAAAVDEFEKRHANCLTSAQTNPLAQMLPEMKQSFINRADTFKRCALRCRQAFNNLVNEIQL